MRKASNVLYIVGAILTLLGLPVFIAMVLVSFGIANPSYTQNIVDGINSGSISTTGLSGTPEEIAAVIQSYFRTFAIIFTVFGVLNIAKFVMAITAKRSNSNPFHITALVLSILTVDPVLVVGSILALVCNKKEGDVEEISASI